MASKGQPEAGPAPRILVPEIRNYQRINAEATRLLDEGHPHIILQGVESQRLLLAGLSGLWKAVVEVEGHAGPEFAAGLHAPSLTVVCRGNAADGAGSGLRRGMLIVAGNGGFAVGYGQAGGLILVAGSSEARAGSRQQGGCLLLLGPTGRLTGERQVGGTIFAPEGGLGPHPSHGQTGGHLIRTPRGSDPISSLATELAERVRPFLAH